MSAANEKKDSGIVVPDHVKKVVDGELKKRQEEDSKLLGKKLEGISNRLAEIKEWALERGFIVEERIVHRMSLEARPMNPSEKSNYETFKEQLKKAQEEAQKNAAKAEKKK